MTSPRERQLAEGINNYLLGIQKSEQINKSLCKWEEKVVEMNQKEVKEIAKIVAAKVELYAISVEKRTNKPPSSEAIMKKIKQELEKS